METGMRHIYKTQGTHASQKRNKIKTCVMIFEACAPSAAASPLAVQPAVAVVVPLAVAGAQAAEELGELSSLVFYRTALSLCPLPLWLSAFASLSAIARL